MNGNPMPSSSTVAQSNQLLGNEKGDRAEALKPRDAVFCNRRKTAQQVREGCNISSNC